MDQRLERIAFLKNSFPTHESVPFLGAKLDDLWIEDDNLSMAEVSAISKPEFTVHSNLKKDRIVQGGIIFTFANFAGVYAAMVHTETHTPLSIVLEMKYKEPIYPGDEMIAVARAQRQDDLIIHAEYWVFVKSAIKMRDIAHYRDIRKK